MIPKTVRSGNFKAASQYYLHDKKANTNERVAFTHTRNLPTDNAELALKIMVHTALTKGTGRCEKPVYTYSLSWSPEETPTKEEMIAAAEESLVANKLLDYEVVMVAHNDEPQPHIHVIVNRIHPETGIAAELKMDWNNLSDWAYEYRRQRGQEHYCPQRIINRQRRLQEKKKKFVKHRAPSRREYEAQKKTQLKQTWQKVPVPFDLPAPAPRFDIHKAERDALYGEKEAHVKHARDVVRATYRPQWSEMYKRQWKEKRELNTMQKNAYRRLLFFLKHHRKDPDVRSAAIEAMKAAVGMDNPHARLARKHDAERKKLADEVTRETRKAMAHENQLYRADLNKLKELQRKEKADRKEQLLRETRPPEIQIPQQVDEREPDTRETKADQTKEPQALAEQDEAREGLRSRRKRRERGERIRRPRKPRGPRGKGRDDDPGRERDDDD